VTEPEIERAVSLMIMIEKTVAEGAGAAVLAALAAQPERFRGRRTCLVVSVQSYDQRLLAGVLMRDLAPSGRLRRICVAVARPAGELRGVGRKVAKAGATSLTSRAPQPHVGPHRQETELKFLIEVRGDAQSRCRAGRLRELGSRCGRERGVGIVAAGSNESVRRRRLPAYSNSLRRRRSRSAP